MSDNFEFDLPSNISSIIKVMGVGGGGSNAVKHMYNRGIKDVEFVVCNTDLQALQLNPVPNKLQIGPTLTEGLGAGANPEKGRQAALENREDIKGLLKQGTKMLFLTAGMGGGTGTGATPVIAEIAQELGILTVAIVTAPFFFEGKRKGKQAKLGIETLKKYCDTVLIISNDRLREIYGNLKMSDAFAQADNVLATAAKGIAEIISVHAEINVDFEDVRTVMRKSGAAVMGSARTEGDNRALRAAQEALSSPLLDNQNITGAKKILLSIMSGDKAELQMDELTDITSFIEEQVGDDADMIFGHGLEPALGDSIRVTIIATGFSVPDVKMNIGDESQLRNVVLDVKPVAKLEEEEKKEPEIKEVAEVSPEEPEDRIIVYKLDEETDDGQNVKTEVNELEEKIETLSNEAEDRINRLKQLSKNMDNDDLKSQLDIPAYLRKGVQFDEEDGE